MHELSSAQLSMLYVIKSCGDPFRGSVNVPAARRTLRSLREADLVTVNERALTARGELAVQLQAMPPRLTTRPTDDEARAMQMLADGWAPTYGPAVLGRAIHLQLVCNGWLEQAADGSAKLTGAGLAALQSRR